MQKAFDLEKEESKEKVKVTSLEIIVTGTKEKPYFEIKYKEVGKEDYCIGYSSYDLNNVFGWKEECFEIVNQVAEEYSHRNGDLVIDFSRRINSLDEVINRLQYKADNIKAKLEPSYFTECIDYLKSLPKCDDGWIPCERKLPSEDGFYNVTVKFWHLNKPTVISSHFECGKWTCVALDEEDVVLAWRNLPQPYVKGE